MFQNHAARDIEEYLNIASLRLPALAHILREYGDVPLSTYLQEYLPAQVPPYQSRNDLFNVVYQYVAPLLGESLAQRAVRDLIASPVALTANHHGVDYYSQSIQGSLLFALNVLTGKSQATTVLIFACGNIPLNNVTYPRGVLLYHLSENNGERFSQKLPIFPEYLKHSLVAVTTPFNTDMITKAQGRLHAMLRAGHISHLQHSTVLNLIQQEYYPTDALSLASYSDQAVVFNQRVWQRCFAGDIAVPDMVYLEFEKIVARLLENDLADQTSLAWRTLFDPVLRQCILQELDGIKGCWTHENLTARLYSKHETSSRHSSTICGTIFFWGVDCNGKRIPLLLQHDSSNGDALRGVDEHGRLHEIPYHPEALIQALRQNTLLPSLFTCFLAVAFARGIVCIGAYFQADYLPDMQQRIVAAIRHVSAYDEMAQAVALVPTQCYLPGMIAVMTKIKDSMLIPAGTIEIIAGGGMTPADIRQIGNITIREAHIAALFETLPDVICPKNFPSQWKRQLADDCAYLLGDKIVVK